MSRTHQAGVDEFVTPDRYTPDEPADDPVNRVHMCHAGHTNQMTARTESGEKFRIGHHRLIAYAHGMIDQLWGYEVVVHHKDGIPMHNYASNLEGLTAREHAQLHADNPGITHDAGIPR